MQEFGHVPELETGSDGVAHLLVALGMCKPDELAVEERRVFKEAQENDSAPFWEPEQASISQPNEDSWIDEFLAVSAAR